MCNFGVPTCDGLLIGVSLNELHTSVTALLDACVCIRESVDSLCRDGADTQMQYLRWHSTLFFFEVDKPGNPC